MQGRDCGLYFCSPGYSRPDDEANSRDLPLRHRRHVKTALVSARVRDGATASTTVETVVRTAGVASTSDVLSADALMFRDA